MDLTESITPKSDQLNAEDFLSGPRTVTITEVSAGTAEQPVNVQVAEFPGRPFKPSKSMRRVMVAAWGKDSSVYAGRRMTLYRDATVRFGGQDVGGIRISHMSDLDKRLTLALTVTRGKRAAYVVEPLKDTPAPARPTGPAPITDAQVTDIMRALTTAGLDDRDEALAKLREVTGRDVRGPRDLTTTEAHTLIDTLTAVTAGGAA